jgi:hypothetical protein
MAGQARAAATPPPILTLTNSAALPGDPAAAVLNQGGNAVAASQIFAEPSGDQP